MNERTLYYVNGSIPNWRVLLALHEKGLTFRPRRLRVMREPRETRSPEFLALNPRGQTPVLVETEGDVVMNESLGLLVYLEMRYPEPPLLPPRGEPAALARALAWVHEAEGLACAYDPLEQLFATPPEQLTAAQREQIRGALAAIDADLSLWESRLTGRPFLQDSFGLADCAFYPVLGYLLRRGLSLAAFPALDAYQRRVRERPAAVASHPEGWHHDRAQPDLFGLARALG